MSKESDILRLRVLLCFLQADKNGCTVTGLSKTLGEEKYTVSRVITALEKDMLIDRSNGRRPILTDKGKRKAEQYAERINITVSHLMYEGVDMESARNDSFYWALYCSEQTMSAVRATEQRYRVKQELCDIKCFGGALLAGKLNDGLYKFPFIIYRENFKNGNNLSSLNNCFAHPCVLSIKSGTGNIQLCCVRNSKTYKRIKALKYYYEEKYYESEICGDILQFPFEVLKFENLGVGIGQILHGSVCIEVSYYNEHNKLIETMEMFTILI